MLNQRPTLSVVSGQGANKAQDLTAELRGGVLGVHLPIMPIVRAKAVQVKVPVMSNTDSDRTRILRYVFFSLGASYSSGQSSSANGPLESYGPNHHSERRSVRGATQISQNISGEPTQERGTTLVRVHTNLRRCILAFSKLPIVATKLYLLSLAP